MSAAISLRNRFLRNDLAVGWTLLRDFGRVYVRVCVWQVYEFDFRSIAQGEREGGVEETLGLTMHQCNLMVVRGARFKLIQFNGDLAPLLYDIEADPGESRNLAAEPAYATALLELTQQALRHRMTFVDRGLADSMSSKAEDGSRLLTMTRHAHLLDRAAPGAAAPAKL